MRVMILVSSLLLIAGVLEAQDSSITIRAERDRLDPRQLPRDVIDAVLRAYNDPGTVHFSGRVRIPTARSIEGDVVVLGGPVQVAGRIFGFLVVINGDLELEPGAVVGGDVLVVGGVVRGEGEAEIAGEVTSYREILRYRRDGDEMTWAPERELPRWARRFRRDDDGRRSHSEFFAALGGTYNRVEGVPIVFGPRTEVWLSRDARFQGDLFGIVRSGRNFSLDDGDVGYRLRGEVLFGARDRNIGLGARAFDQMNSIESWPLKDYEAGWGAFLLHRDYRDLYRRRGVSGYAVFRPARYSLVQLEAREERHFSAAERDPWTIFRSDQPWRINPPVTDGVFRSVALSFRLDRRNDRSDPTSGYFVQGEVESGRGTSITGNIDPTIVCITFPCHGGEYDDGRLDYRRLFLDARTYLRVTPGGRLALRAAGGGRLGGETLPLQRRVSLGGPDPLPGYGFRQLACDPVGLAARPALCDRVILGQVEFRTHLGFDFGPGWLSDWGDDEADYEPFHVSGPDIVVFADAGHAWNVGTGPGELRPGQLPPLGRYSADVGLGLDFGPLGFYLARAVGRAGGSRDVTFTVRMGRRF
jgi:hypothetical protein